MNPPFEKLLVANRGEIAVRVIRACRELGIRTVAVYSEADAGSLHRRLADESYPIGPAPATESYLNIGRIADVIRKSGADAVHPGYGFLSENAAFARAVEETGAVWIGPPPEAMEAMALKTRAKQLAQRAGVPTVPGFMDPDADDEKLAGAAREIGYPVLIKASAGGGGRGMRAVADPKEFPEAVQSARREAASAFGDGSVFLEKLIERPRHIEVQVIGDKHGNVIHLYERECSIQRRHQKIVEEAPSPALDAQKREEVCAAAVRLAREAGYHNAGTVEFLFDGENFYFLEVNARLQVEHPVTEFVTGMDLLHLQIAVAAGERLPVSQEEITLRGSAIEARVYAEDEAGLPSGGELLACELPEGPGIRNDAGFEAGDVVPLNYDPMLAKLIVWAPDRRRAVRRLRRALADYTILGPASNLPLLRRIAAEPDFLSGETHVSFLEEHGLTGAPTGPRRVPEEAVLLAAAAETSSPRGGVDPFDSGPWRGGGWELRYLLEGEERRVGVRRAAGGALRVESDGKVSLLEEVRVAEGRISASCDGKILRGSFAQDGGALFVSLEGESYRFVRPEPLRADGGGGTGASGRTSLTAPMPGTVIKVFAAEGEEVVEGQPLLVLEAMKTEQTVSAPYAGRVKRIPFSEGEVVPGGAVLAEMEREGG